MDSNSNSCTESSDNESSSYDGEDTLTYGGDTEALAHGDDPEDTSSLSSSPSEEDTVDLDPPAPSVSRKRKRRQISYSPIDSSLIENTYRCLKPGDLEDIQGLVCGNIRIVIPGHDVSIMEPPEPSFFGVHLLSVQVGLRFPLHPFLIEFLNFYEIAPGQLAPNGHQVIAGFLSVCRQKRMKPSLGLFQSLFRVMRSPREGKGFVCISSMPRKPLFDDRPSFNKDWKSRFFFVSLGIPSPFAVAWGTRVRCHPTLDESPNMLRKVKKLLKGGPFKVVDSTSEWWLQDLGFERIRPAALDVPGAMSSKGAISSTAARYLSQSGQYPSKRSKTDKKGKKSQASTSGGGACNLTLPRTRSSTQPGSSIQPPAPTSDVDPLPEGLSAQPPEQGEALPVPRVRTNLVRLGMDVLPGKSFLEGTIDAPELVRSLVTPRDAEILEDQGFAALRERYCKMAMESVLIGDSLHSQYEAMLRDSLSQRNKLAEDQLLQDAELKELREEIITLKTDYSKLEQKLKDERKGHKETRATVTKLEKARETYRQSSEFKDDVRKFMSTPEAVEEFSASAAGRAALEAQTQLAFDLGMFTMQQQIYPVLKEENPNFDPEAVGLPKFMENPDPESEEYDISPVDADDAGVSDRPDNTNTDAQDAAEDPTTATKDA